MAEALGLIASIVALIQLADMVTETAKRHVSTAKGAQSVLNALLGKLYGLSSVLGTLKTRLDAKSLGSVESLSLQQLREPLRICEDVLTRLKTRLDSLRMVGGYVVGSLMDKNTTVQLKQLDDLIPVLQLALDVDNLASSQAVACDVQSLRIENAEQAQKLHQGIQAHRQDALQWRLEADQLKEASSESKFRGIIFDWLARGDPETNYRSACQRQQPGTGKWLLDSQQFAEWEAGRSPHLWLHAMAGAGKTILSSTVISHLISKYTDTNVAYFFFDFKDAAKQEVLSLMCSLVAQASCTLQPLPKALLSLFQRHSVRNPDHPSSPTVPELLPVLSTVTAQLEIFFIVIDALDECMQRPALLETIGTIFNIIGSHCRVLCTSRAETDIQRSLSKLHVRELQIQTQQVDEDVALYVGTVLETDDRLRLHRQGIKDLIAETLTKGSKGMFRWVQCQVDHIRTLRTAKEVKSALQQLPPDLDQTYDNILLGVRPADHEYLRRALKLTVFSARPMTLAEVAEAIIIEPGMSEIDEDARLQRPEDLLDIGGSLFAQVSAVSNNASLLELSHYSVKEYLLSERVRNGPAAAFAIDEIEAEITNATCCLTYLGLPLFGKLWRDFDTKTWVRGRQHDTAVEEKFLIWQQYERLELYPFLDYAAKACFRHCRIEAVQKVVSPLVRKIFAAEGSGIFRNMTYTCVFKPDESWVTLYMRTFRYSLISVVARYGLKLIVQDLLTDGISADYLPSVPSWVERYPEGQTALYRAADFGHEELCRALIDAGANVNGEHIYDCPLSAAGRAGNPTILRLFLDVGADVRKDSRPIAETLLVAWWKYAEGDNHWKEVLEVFRGAGAKWSTIGLLAAFSRSTTPLIRRVIELLADEAGLPRASLTSQSSFRKAVEEIEIDTLDALQWLVQDIYGADGFKGCLEYFLCAIYDSQLHIFKPNPRFHAQKYSAEEVLAENLIRTYFQPVRFAEFEADWSFPEDHNILTVGWDSISSLPAHARERMPFSSVELAKAEGLIVCGDILRALIRDRWVHEYAHFFE